MSINFHFLQHSLLEHDELISCILYDGPNGSFFYFDTNSQFRIPNSEF